MYMLVRMMLVARANASRDTPYAPPPLLHPYGLPPPSRPDDHRESELAGDNRIRFAPIELLTAVRNVTRDTMAPRENNYCILIVRTRENCIDQRSGLSN